MPARIRPPKYCRHREKNRADRAYCVLDGKRHALGIYGTAESYKKFSDLINGDPPREKKTAAPAPTALSLVVLMADYLEHCIDAYGGEKSSEVYHLKGAFKILRRTHGELLAKDFGPKAFTELRLEFINAGWSRTYIGDQCGRIKRMFAWGVAQEVLHGDARHRLDAVRPLKPGEHGVRETPPVKPVSQADLDATLKLMKPERADQVRLLLLTGMRPQELMQLSVEHIDRTTDVWTYRPPQHKTQRYGKDRVVAIGPRAQEILTPYLFRKPCFTATRDALRNAVRRAAKRAGVPHWWPYRCRHNAATVARAAGGLEAAQHLLGHSKASTTEIYAEINQRVAVDTARNIG